MGVLISEVVDEACYRIETDCGADLEKIRNMLLMLLSKYELTEKTTEITAYYENEDLQHYKRFFTLKKLQGRAESTLRYYNQILKQLFAFVNKPFAEYTSDDIHVYLAEKSMHVSNVTLNNERRVFNAFFDFLQEEDYVVLNPMRRVKKIKEERKVKKPFSEEELERLRSKCVSLRDKALFEFFYSTGCRVSEVTGLKVKDVDLREREATVMGKGAKERVVFLNTKSILALEDYLKERDAKPSEALFCGERKQHGEYKGISKSAVEVLFRSWGTEANIEEVHPHRMRRTMATTALQRGVPLDEVRQMLGHESLGTTMIYAKSQYKDVKRSHEKYF